MGNFNAKNNLLTQPTPKKETIKLLDKVSELHTQVLEDKS